MTATETEKALFRIEFGGDDTSLPDDYIDGLFNTAEAIYGTEDRTKVQTAAYLYHATSERAKSMESVNYKANTASEDLSVVYERWNALVAKYQADLDLITKDLTAARWMPFYKKPQPFRRYPGSYQ